MDTGTKSRLNTLSCLYLELGDGHYWVEEPGLTINFPLRFVGDEHDPSHVVIELSGTVRWNASGGWMEGITFRRPKITAATVAREMLFVKGDGKIDMIQCVFDNEGGNETVVAVSGKGSKGRWESVVVRNGTNGIRVDEKATLNLVKVSCKTDGLKIKRLAAFDAEL